MSEIVKPKEIFPYVTINGHKWPRNERYPVENFELIQKLDLRQGDIVLNVYPRCGSNWLSYIFEQIITKGTFPPDIRKLLQEVNFIDFYGLPNERESKTSLRVKTHIALPYFPFSPLAKYVVVIRNPFDCCVSFYHLLVDTGRGSDVAFDDFFEVFFSGEMGFGDYFDHLVRWYQLRDEPNVKLMIYEEMIKDRRNSIIELASFLGQEYLDVMTGDTLDLVVEKTSFNSMKKDIQYVSTTLKNKNVDFIRSGTVGNWKTLFSESQKMRLKDKMVERLKDTKILAYWLNILQL